MTTKYKDKKTRNCRWVEILILLLMIGYMVSVAILMFSLKEDVENGKYEKVGWWFLDETGKQGDE